MQRWRLSGTCTHRTSSFIGTQCPTVLSNFINHMITRPAMSKVSSSSPRVFFSREYDVWSHGVCGVAPFTLAQRRGYTTGVPGQDEPRNGAYSSHPSATRAGPVSSTPHSEDPDISMKIFSSTMLHSKFELRTPSASSAPEHDNEAVANPEGRTHVDPPISAGNIHSSTSEQAKETGSESIPAGPTTESASAFSSLAPTSSSPHDDPPLETESRSGSVVSTDETYVVQAFSQACRRAEGRADQIEAVVWREDTTYPPILSKPGQKNVYYHTDEIPAHVEPFYAHHPQQQREYFRLMSQVVPWWRRLLKWGAVLLGCGAFLYLMALLEVWYHQPREILLLREEILRHAYGTVLELGAGQGTNVGFYPYPAHDVYFMDQDEILLRRLKLRLPKTVFPTYHILQRKVEELDTFPAGSYDTVVDMFGLCHYRDPVFVLRQLQRIVKPTGVILLLEHGRTPYPIVNAFLDWYAEKHQVNTHGCRWNRPLEEHIQESRLLIKEKRRPHFGTTLYVVAYPEVVEETLKSEST